MQQHGREQNQSRDFFPEIQYLRALAITLVLTYHFTARRSTLLPYGDWASKFPFSIGWVGVYLFFVISGFVIAVTLRSSHDAGSFLRKRLARIYPGLLIILPIVFLVQRFTPHSLFVDRTNLPNLLTSILLLPPNVLNTMFDLNLDWVTLVLWSLKVEVCFYLIVYALRIRFSIERTLKTLPVLSTGIGLALILQQHVLPKFGIDVSLTNPMRWFALDFLSWFAVGVILAEFSGGSLTIFNWFSLVLNTAFALINLGNYHELNLGLITCILLLIGLIPFLEKIRKNGVKFNNKLIISLGNSSYELYLLHQGVGFTLIYYLSRNLHLDSVGTISISLAVTLLCIYFSYIIWSRITSKLTRRLRT